ncbi:hypothetical protein HN385_00965 [archaeon]|jgi:hypothetical protein|nr:hypothetical protein [archaeon]MBT3450621.1 hypothetical protein [archaeon]MBT6868693.1 hypothetical protein [archaeon]MBT7193481.1 hypothetical protein [archaeon]MBT7381072.1 hypothetical protein [archaeon]
MNKNKDKNDLKKVSNVKKDNHISSSNLKSNITKSLKYDWVVLMLIALILLSSVFIVRNYSGNPLLYQAESYSHFSAVKSYTNLDIHFWELNPLEMGVYLLSLLVNVSLIRNYIFLLSPLLALGSILLFMKFVENLKLDRFKSFIFIFILILTPSFTLNFSTLSNYSIIIFLASLGLCLLSLKNIFWKYLSIIPFCIITLFEGLSTFLMLGVLIAYYFQSNLFPIIRSKLKNDQRNIRKDTNTKSNKINKNSQIDKKSNQDGTVKNKNPTFLSKIVDELISFEVTKLIIFLLLILLFANKLFLGTNWVTESFISDLFFSNFISDLGAFSGISIFVLFLALLGLFSSWKQKGSLIGYVGLTISLISYYFNNNAIIFIGLIMAYFASDFIQWVIDRKWSLNEAKNFTLLLIFLGLLFSSVSYVERLSDYSPYQENLDTISWLEDYFSNENNLTENSLDYETNGVVLLSSPENSQYISALSSFSTFPDISDLENHDLDLWHKVNMQLERDSYIEGKEVFSLTYPSVLFPLLEEYNVKYIYVDPQLRVEFYNKKGLLFALRNERFKLIHSQNEHEIWEFKNE